jgi:hypothetical protein
VLDSGPGQTVTRQQPYRGAAGAGLGQAVVLGRGLYGVLVHHDDVLAGDGIASLGTQRFLGLGHDQIVLGDATGKQKGRRCTGGQDAIELGYTAHEKVLSLLSGMSTRSVSHQVRRCSRKVTEIF